MFEASSDGPRSTASGRLQPSNRPSGPGGRPRLVKPYVHQVWGKPIEFEKGKAGIAVPSKDKLPTVKDTLIAPVRAGELDELFSQAARAGSIGKARKAA